MGYRVGVDIGGTFTDCCVVAPDGRRAAGQHAVDMEAVGGDVDARPARSESGWVATLIDRRDLTPEQAATMRDECAALASLIERGAYADLLAAALDVGREYARAYAAAKRRVSGRSRAWKAGLSW